MTSAAVARPRRNRMSMICRSRRVRTECSDLLMCYFHRTTCERNNTHADRCQGAAGGVRHRDRIDSKDANRLFATLWALPLGWPASAFGVWSLGFGVGVGTWDLRVGVSGTET